MWAAERLESLEVYTVDNSRTWTLRCLEKKSNSYIKLRTDIEQSITKYDVYEREIRLSSGAFPGWL